MVYFGGRTNLGKSFERKNLYFFLMRRSRAPKAEKRWDMTHHPPLPFRSPLVGLYTTTCNVCAEREGGEGGGVGGEEKERRTNQGKKQRDENQEKKINRRNQ